jgi:hypothetical protein
MSVNPEQVAAFLEPYRQLWDHYATTPWDWVKDCVRTRNEDVDTDKGEQAENVPVPDLPHLREMVWAWYAVKLLQIDKSRQMMATWTMCFMIVHEAMFVEAANIGYQHTKTKEAAGKVEKYMLYVLTRQPLEYMLPWIEEREHPPKRWVETIASEFALSMAPPSNPKPDQPPYMNSEAYLVARQLSNIYRTTSGPEGIEGVEFEPYFSASLRYVEVVASGSNGADKWRGQTRTRAVHDEAFFYQDLADNINSALKTVGKNGRQVLVCTASRGKDGNDEPLRMIKEATQQPESFGGFRGQPEKRANEMPHGVQLWLTQDKYTHMRIWYYADPNKRSPEYYEENVRTGNLRKNRREVLISYDEPEGEPYYPSYNPDTQLVQRRVNPGSFLVIGQDGGRTPASVVVEVLSSGRVIAGRELVSQGVSVTTHGERLKSMLNLHYPGWQSSHLMAVDPTMLDARGEANDETSGQVLERLGFQLVPGIQDPDRRFDVVSTFCLTGVVDEYGNRPKFVLDPNGCPTLHAGFMGGCTLSPHDEKVGRNRKLKNSFSHPMDAFEYACTVIEQGYGVPVEPEDYTMMVHQMKR